MSSSGSSDNRKKDILILGNGQTQELDDIKLTAKKECARNFSEQQTKFCLCLHHNGKNSYLFVSSLEIYKFKARDSDKLQLHYVWVMLRKIFQLII